MIFQAVIVIPPGGAELPSYLFGSVAGMPFLVRQILGLKRAGVTWITILIAANHIAALEKKLSRYRHLAGNLEVVCRWPELRKPAGSDQEAGYILLLPVSCLPTPAVFAALRNNLPSPGGLSIVAIPEGGSDLTPLAVGRTWGLTATLPTNQCRDNGSTTTNPDVPSQGRQTGGLSLFSIAAWQEWLRWPKPGQEGLLRSEGTWLAAFSEFVAWKTQQSQVQGVSLEPNALISVSRDEDRAVATAHLIALENDSPLGEGILEKSWNRRLARFILPLVLERPITPNQITLLSFLVGLLAVWGFAHGSYAASVVAGLLLPLILVLDCLDGAVARLKYQESRLGALLDLHGDSVINFLLFLGIAVGCYRSSGQPLYLGLGVLIALGYIACWRLIRPPKQAQTWSGEKGPISKTLGEKIMDEAISRDFFYIILLMAICQRLTWLVVALAAGTNVFAWLYYRRQANE